MTEFIVKVDGEIEGRYNDEGTAQLIMDAIEQDDGVQPELIHMEEVKTIEDHFDEDGVYDTDNKGVGRWPWVVLDEEGYPQAAFWNEMDMEYQVDQIEKSEGYTPVVITTNDKDQYIRHEIKS